MPRTIPDRWLEYKPYGTVIEGTKILPFKVPLKKELTRSLPAEQRFTPELLMNTFPKLKCIIDLTNTHRYYSGKDIKKAGLKYLKLMIPGREVPCPEYVQKFVKALEKFNLSIKSDELIGVHCTHGINRSGYLICRYIMQHLGWTPQESLNAFAKARGYGIKRPAYVATLMQSPPPTRNSVSHVGSRSPGYPANDIRLARERSQWQHGCRTPEDDSLPIKRPRMQHMRLPPLGMASGSKSPDFTVDTFDENLRD